MWWTLEFTSSLQQKRDVILEFMTNPYELIHQIEYGLLLCLRLKHCKRNLAVRSRTWKTLCFWVTCWRNILCRNLVTSHLLSWLQKLKQNLQQDFCSDLLFAGTGPCFNYLGETLIERFPWRQLVFVTNFAWLKMCLRSCFKKPHPPRHQGIPQIRHHVWFATWYRRSWN